MSPLNLKFWDDFADSHAIVAKALKRRPIVAGIVVLLAAWQSFLENGGLLGIVESFLVLALSCSVVFETWSAVTGAERPDPKQDSKYLASVWGNSILYSIVTGLGLMLLVVPGIYMCIAASLGLVIVCIEKVKAYAALEDSVSLVRTHFWESFRYLFPMLFFFVATVVGSFLSGYGVQLIAESMADSGLKTETLIGASALVTTSIDLFSNWMLLSVVTMQVRLYKALKESRAAS